MVAFHHFICPLIFIKVALQHLSCLISTYWGGFVLSLLFHVSSIWLVCIIPGVSLQLTELAVYNFLCLTVSYWECSWCLKCPTAAYWGGSALFQAYHFLSHMWLHITTRCSIAIYCSVSLSLNMLHFNYFPWLNVIPGTPWSSLWCFDLPYLFHCSH